MNFFNATSIIFGLELAAVVLAIFRARTRLQGKAVTVFIDNNAALAALINGDSTSIAAYYLIATFRYIVFAYDIAIWFDRVESARNIADLPTRNRSLPFPVGEIAYFPHIQEVLNFYQEKIARYIPPNTAGEMSDGPYTAMIFE